MCALAASQNVAVTHPYVGLYCINAPGVTAANSGAVAMLGFSADSGAQIVYSNSGSCGNVPEVVTELSGANHDEPFFFIVP
jgi:hypothetical protein